MTKTLKLMLTLAATALVAAVLWLQLPGRGFSSDLSGLGNGRPALVLAFENYSPAGMHAMEQLVKLRADYEGRMTFHVADLATAHGREFVKRHGLQDGMFVLVGPDGAPAGPPEATTDAARLRMRLDLLLQQHPDG